ncbi:hypothetical protein GQ457_08G026790 [Hibiscus cannabinus]
MKHRIPLDDSIDLVGTLLYWLAQGSVVLDAIMEPDLSLVNGLKSMVIETHCGSLTHYGMKHLRAFVNILQQWCFPIFTAGSLCCHMQQRPRSKKMASLKPWV